MNKSIHKAFFVIRRRNLTRLLGTIRNFYYKALGMSIGKGTLLPTIFTTWPHKVRIGNNCSIEGQVIFKYDGIWSPDKGIIIGNNTFIGYGCEFNISKQVTIGNDCLIASGCKFIDHDHGMLLNQLMCIQPPQIAEIKVGNDVWMGVNVVLLKGVTISDGVIVAAGAVVTKSIPANEIWGGVPAKKISERTKFMK